MSTTSKESVSTWANGFGVWHARVDFDGFGPDDLDASINRIRAKARRAIRRELLARAGQSTTLAPTRIEVCETSTKSITYRESSVKPKTHVLYVVQGQYGQGWEDLTASVIRDEARSDAKAYRDNDTAPIRIIRRRELTGN